MAIPVKLPVFEGPLDLLMHLIEKNKIDIYDIPIVEITDQYLEYVHQMDHEDMDVTSEFLVMAATLLDIKSRMLLPREKDEETGEEEGDPREELVRRLLEYKMYKYMSEELAVCREQAGVRYFRAQDLPKEVRTYQPPIDYEDLLKDTDLKKLEKVFGEVLRRKKSRRDPIRSGFGKIRREEVNIDTKALYIRAYLQAHPRTEFRALLESQESKEEVIVTFLILLELMKNQKVHIVQDSICGTILIESSETAEENSAQLPEVPGPEVPDSDDVSDFETDPDPEVPDSNDVSDPETDPAPEVPDPDDVSDPETDPAPEVPDPENSDPDDVSGPETLPVDDTDETDSADGPSNLTVFSVFPDAADDFPADSAEDDWSDWSLEEIPMEVTEEEKTPEKDLAEHDEGSTPAEAPGEDSSGISSLSIRTRIEVVSPVLPFRPEEENPAADLPLTDEKDSLQEASPLHFSQHLWYGRIPRHISPLYGFGDGSICVSKSGRWAPARRLRRDNPVWEQTRLSRLWARRL